MGEMTRVDVLYELDDEDCAVEPELDAAYASACAAVRDLLKLDDVEMRGLLIGPTFRLATLLGVAVDYGWGAAMAKEGAAK